MVKNILILTDKLKYNCGVSTYLFNFLTSANEIGIDFYLYTSGGDRINDFKPLVKHICISERFDYYNRGILNTSYYIFSVFLFCVKNQIEIIHSQNYYVANVANIVSKIINVKTIQTHNNLFPERKLKQFVSKAHIVVNEHMYDHALSKAKVNANNIRLIRYGLSIPDELYYKASSFNIVSSARLIEEKGIDTFIKAVSILNPKFKQECNFYIAGEGEYENTLKALNTQLNAGIKFLGKLNGMQDLLKKSKIFVNPSKWGSEGFPFALIEAGFFGNLVITSDFTGVTSVFDPKVDGFLFRKGDFKSLKYILEETISNFDNYKNRIDAFNTKVKRLFDINNTVTETVNYYNYL